MIKNISKKRSTDIVYEHCTRVNEKDIMKLRCNYCQTVNSRGSIHMKHHLARTHKDVAACKKNSDEVRDLFKGVLNEIDKKKQIEDDGIAEFLEEVTDASVKRRTLNAMVNNEIGNKPL